ncbi:MAG: proline iminopeptidase-family hydrolase [Acidobacteria bacterium]|nr:proline iminopeptidase-family hydrolase [Acidobacteriota bacterium]MCI0723745.1 proline iminopeptidase-family hydrolase [Acidobacteriota bacterium]
MPSDVPVREGYIPFRDFKVWYRVVGEQQSADKLPLLCLHGGPGATHDYLEPIEEAASQGRQVIFYDQLGSGKSDHPNDPSLWAVPLFVEEVGVVRQALRLEQVHLFGQSWGGMLGMEYALTRPQGLASLIVANSPASMPQWLAEANRLRAALPSGVQQTLLRHESAGTTSDAAYQEAVMVFYRRHLCRLDTWPDCVNRSFEKLAQYPEVYHTMNGPSEFHCIGTLKNWSIVDRLGEIRVPVLLLSGRYDEATPTIVETIHRGIPASEWVLFENSSHMPHVEEPERFMNVLNDFLKRTEQQASQPVNSIS